MIKSVNTYEPEETTIFSTENSFQGDNPQDDTSFICRLTITQSKASGKLIARPEKLNEESGQWIPLRPAAWNLETVLHSRGLCLDFGASRTISPNKEVWQEILTRLNEHQTA